MDSLADIWKLITHLPLGQLIALWTGLSALLAMAYGLGHWASKHLHVSKEIALKAQLTALEQESIKLKEMPKVVVKLAEEDDVIRRIGHLLRHGFSGDNLIHPYIIEELTGWLSDPAPVTVAINLEGAIKSNKYSTPFEVKTLRNNEKWVQADNDVERTFFSYRYLGTSPSGINALLTRYSGGGSGTFYDILFIIFQIDNYLTYETKSKAQDRVLIKCIGHLYLGDRYDGEIKFESGQLTIGARVSWYPEYRPESEILIIE